MIRVDLPNYLGASQVYVVVTRIRRWRLHVVWGLWCAVKVIGLGSFGFGLGLGGLDTLAMLVQVAFDGGGRFD